jgi:hypothetical protein
VGGGVVTWTKLSDDFSDDCWELSDAAVRLHVEGLNWTMRKLTGGALIKDEMLRWAKRPGAAEELTDRGYWRDEGDYYYIVHHMGYQREPDKVLAQQEANRLNGKKGGRPRGTDIRPPETDSLTQSLNDSKTESVAETDSLSDSKTERDWSGLDRPGTEGDQLTKRSNEKIDDPYGDVMDDAHERELAGYFEAGAAYEPPAFDADGNPLDDWEPR